MFFTAYELKEDAMDLGERLGARIRARKLDRALARGEAPNGNAAMARRAHALVRADTRVALAASLRRIASGGGTPRTLGTRVAAAGASERAARSELDRLAERLLEPGPVDPRGVALTQELLSDGAGPLFWKENGDDLSARLRVAIEALEPRGESHATKREETKGER